MRLGLPPDSKKPLPPAGNQSRNRSYGQPKRISIGERISGQNPIDYGADSGNESERGHIEGNSLELKRLSLVIEIWG